jgi:Skp family chaperone for outer membrane proteins
MSESNGQTNDLQLAHTSQIAGEDYVTDIVPAYAYQHVEILREFRLKLQSFLSRLNSLPRQESIDTTPDGKAYTILISHIEMTLDEFFFGLWETYDFKWSTIANEVVGSILLEVVHPVTGQKLKRQGAAAIQIMVDKVPDDLQEQRGDSMAEKMEKKRKRNQWANNPENKKSSALDMGFPKLKAECLKNAAQSFGKLFGRDLNRQKVDNFQPLAKNVSKAASATAAAEQMLKDVVNSIPPKP